MKQCLHKLLAVLLAAFLCVPLLSSGAVPAAAADDSGIYWTAEETLPLPVERKISGKERTVNFNSGWKFYLGDFQDAYTKSFIDSSWQNINLPHDFSISQNFTANGEAESGFLPGGTGWYRKTFTLPAAASGKSIVLNFDGVYKDATVYVNGEKVGEHHYGYTPFAFDISKKLICDGTTKNLIAVRADHQIPSSRWYSGSGIYRDVKLIMTDPVHVAYNGTYVTTPNLKTSNGTDGTVNISVDVQNDSAAAASVTVRNTIYKKDTSASIVSADLAPVTVAANGQQKAEGVLKVESPALWSPEDPNLYVVKTEILKDGNNSPCDTYETEFGFKWYEFANNTGFKLNGNNVKIKGVCMHHDQGALGSAAYYDAIYRQMSIMKDMGVNTIRITHNPGAEILVDICNELGLLVIEEFFDGWAWAKNGNSNDFSVHFTENLTADNKIIGGSSSMTWAEFVLKSTVKRDRNDASIILWSLGNEIDEGSGGGPWNVHADNLIKWTKDVDTTHPVTSGSNRRKLKEDPNDTSVYVVNQKVYEAGGVPGYNYGDLAELTSLHGKYPVMLWSETASAVNSRGIYMSQDSQGNADGRYHLTSYDTSAVSWGKTAHDSIYPTLSTDWIAGECVWTGFDYIGEPTPWNGTGTGDGGRGAIPNSSYFGIVETSGFPKDNYYLYQSQWHPTDKTLHLVTAWDSENMMQTNGKTPVWIYSDAAKVELYRNGQLIGIATGTERTTSAGHKYYTYTTESKNTSVCATASGTGSASLYSIFYVAFEAGTISAKAYDAAGNEITSRCKGTRSVSTPGRANKLVATKDKNSILADGSSLSYIAVDVTDANGNLVTTANDNEITFTLTGQGEIAGVDNGDQATTAKFQQASVMRADRKSAKIKAYAGKALVIVRSIRQIGQFTVNISSAGLTGTSVSVQTTLPEGLDPSQFASCRMSSQVYVPAGTPSVDLPQSIPATTVNGQESTLPVSWDTYDTSKLASPNTLVVNGQAGTGEQKINVSCTIHVYGNVAAAQNYSRDTTSGKIPSLPSSLMTYYADGSEFEAFPVTWDMSGITAADFAQAETVKQIRGTVNAVPINKTFEAVASIRVAAEREGSAVNIAPVSATLTQNCSPVADSLASIKNGVKYSDATTERWTDYNDKRAENGDATPPAITMAWDTVHTIDEIRLFYYTDRNVSKPSEVKIYFSSDGNNFNEVACEPAETIPEVTEESTEGAVYRMSQKGQSPIAVRVTLKHNSDGKKVGLMEMEVMSKEYVHDTYNTADLGNISINGQPISGFSADKLDYIVSELGTVTAAGAEGKNVAVLVLPDNGDSVTILTRSEDGTATKKYTVSKGTVTPTPNPGDSGNGGNDGGGGGVQQPQPQPQPQPPADPKPGDKIETDIGNVTIGTDAGTVELGKNDKDIVGALTIVDKVTLPNGKEYTVTSIAPDAYTNGKMTSIKVSDSIETIGKNAFAKCKKVKSVIIGKSIKSIESGAFANCSKLKTLKFTGTTVPKIAKNSFKGSKITKVIVPKALKKNKAFLKAIQKAGIKVKKLS